MVQMVTAFVDYRLAADVSVACEPIVLMIACFFLGFELVLGCLWIGVGLENDFGCMLIWGAGSRL